MDIKTAQLLVENLIGRMKEEDGSRWRLEGALSPMEYDALKLLVGYVTGPERPSSESSGSAVPRNDKTPDESDVIAISKVIKTKINLTAFEYNEPQNAEVTLCLDFGTAMSKAAASLGAEDEFLELKLGELAGQEGVEYPLVSSLFISKTGKVFFGQEAVRESLVHDISGVSRFDSLKQEITLGVTDSSLDQQLVKGGLNPTNIPITKGCLVTAYLAYLTDLACTELETRHGTSRYVKRRFALPVFDGTHAEWGKEQLRSLVAKAQILADTFQGQWQGGIDIADIYDVYNQLLEIGKVPDYLVVDSVLEPIAAAASRIHEDVGNKREMVMVVDVGAGTTDFALFVVAQQGDAIFKVFFIPNTIKGIRQAGDAIDNALRVHILEDAQIDRNSPQRPLIDSNLKLRIRQYKEDLFKNEELSYVLSNNAEGTIRLTDFLESHQIKRFEDLLHKGFVESLKSADESYLKAFENVPLKVVLTGGGASLPMIQDMGSNTVTINSMIIERVLAPSVPDWVNDYLSIREEYPQLAVALGGASSDLPEQGPSFTRFAGIGGEATQWRLEGDRGW